MTTKQVMHQRDELIDLVKEVLDKLDQVANYSNDDSLLEEAEQFQEKLDALIELDSNASSAYS
tara:strand:+ start:845 stop:1033 length:189 start_codon:yes stop_codon:yes gene_type:complete